MFYIFANGRSFLGIGRLSRDQRFSGGEGHRTPYWSPCGDHWWESVAASSPVTCEVRFRRYHPAPQPDIRECIGCGAEPHDKVAMGVLMLRQVCLHSLAQARLVPVSRISPVSRGPVHGSLTWCLHWC